jgi:hypothetical protein
MSLRLLLFFSLHFGLRSGELSRIGGTCSLNYKTSFLVKEVGNDEAHS